MASRYEWSSSTCAELMESDDQEANGYETDKEQSSSSAPRVERGQDSLTRRPSSMQPGRSILVLSSNPVNQERHIARLVVSPLVYLTRGTGMLNGT